MLRGLSTRTGETTGTERDERSNWDRYPSTGFRMMMSVNGAGLSSMSIKDGLMKHSSTEMEKTAVLHYFPFDTVMKKICDILWPYLWKYGIFMTAVSMVPLLYTSFMITLQNQRPRDAYRPAILAISPRSSQFMNDGH